MSWKLMVFIAWRLGGAYGTFLPGLVMLGSIWMIAGTKHGPSVAAALAASMAFAFFAGPVLGFTASDIPELIYLPLSRRQLWRCRVVSALVVPVLAIPAIQTVALAAGRLVAGEGPIGLSTVLLSSLYNTAYVGAGLGIHAWWRLVTGRQGTPRAAALLRLWPAIVLIAGLGPVLPALFWSALPTRWTQLGVTGWLLAGAGLGAALGAFVWSPDLARAGRRQSSLSRGPSAVTGPTRSMGLVGGVARLMWVEVAIAVGMITIVVAGMMCALGGGLHDPFNRVVYGGLVFSMLAAPSGAMLGVRAALGPLRVLPISSRMLGVVLTVQPIVTWLLICLVQAIARAAVGPDAPLLTADAMWWFLGFAPLASVVGLAIGDLRSTRFMIPMIVILVVALAVSELPLSPGPAPLPQSVALGGVALAIWLNTRMVRRRHSLYRSRTPFLLPK